MYVSHLALTDFRSYATAEVGFEPGVTALVGANGQGKTNLVEAIGYVASLSSHRVATDAPLVRQGASRAVVRAVVQRAGRATRVDLEITPGKANRAMVNRSPVPRPREVLGMLRTVLFAPEDLALVKGDPDGRRRFLDDLLVARAPRLAGVRADYERVLRQRNALLKSAGATRAARRAAAELPTLDIWDTHLATTGAELLAARLALVRDLRPHVAASYEAVSRDGVAAGIAYRASLGDDVTEDVLAGPPGAGRAGLQERLLAEVARLRAQEIDRGVSLVGPHRDDLLLSIGELPARGYASHGESWSMALSLRLASYRLLCADSDPAADGEPVLVLDDVFAELDVGRRRRLAELVAPAEQVLITAAVEDDLPAGLAGHRLEVRDGRVFPHAVQTRDDERARSAQ